MTRWVLAAAALLVLWGALAEPDNSEQAQYCAMWEIWHADKRYGWPDVAGRYYEECEQ